MSDSSNVLAIDLGTSSVKVGLFDRSQGLIASATCDYPTLSHEPGMAEQRPGDWLSAIGDAVGRVLPDAQIDLAALVLTAQMPTLVELDERGGALGNAVTWQDSRADALVDSLFDAAQRRLIESVAGTPIDGRYIAAMHLHRARSRDHEATRLLSAKDFLFFALTGEIVTDPSTASGFGCFDLVGQDWSEELCALWGVSEEMLPTVVDSHFRAALGRGGADLLPGVAPGTPVVVGAADSVCAHHFIDSHFGDSISVISGSSTVIMTQLDDGVKDAGEMLVTPLVDSSKRGAEMDLLATGSSIAWLARLFDVTADHIEELALSNRDRSDRAVMFFPYLAGAEQGAIWRTDLSGSVEGLLLDSTRSDLALALFEGIAFETLRCIDRLRTWQPVRQVVVVTPARGHHLAASLLASLLDLPVISLSSPSPSLEGAAIVAFESIGGPAVAAPLDAQVLDGSRMVDVDYRDLLAQKARKYLGAAPGATGPSRALR